jgi:hypothetical protein
MGVADPKKPWAIVFCQFEGSVGEPEVQNDLRALFRPMYDGLFDFWFSQSLGEIDILNAEFYGWYQCEWSVLGAGGHPEYPGASRNMNRAEWHDHAVHLLTKYNSGIDLGHLRGVLSVFNCSAGGGNTGSNVVYGLNGTGRAELSWAEGGWRKCRRCFGMIKRTIATLPCAQQNTPGVIETHDFADSHDYLIPNDQRLVHSVGDLRQCIACGGLYLGDPDGCPAGGKHTAASNRTYQAMQWTSPIGEKHWYPCTACGLIVQDPGGAKCPSTGRDHTLETADRQQLLVHLDDGC